VPIHRAGTEAPQGFESIPDKIQLAAAIPAREHRARGHDNGGDVQPGGAHDHAGRDLVAVGQQHEAVEGMGFGHALDDIGDDLAYR